MGLEGKYKAAIVITLVLCLLIFGKVVLNPHRETVECFKEIKLTNKGLWSYNTIQSVDNVKGILCDDGAEVTRTISTWVGLKDGKHSGKCVILTTCRVLKIMGSSGG